MSERLTIDKALELNKKEKKENSSFRQFLIVFRIYLFPITSIIIFLIIIFVFTIPKIFNIFGQLGEIDRLNEDLQTRQEELIEAQRMAANEATLRRDVDILDSLAPTEVTEVVNFGTRIAELAVENELVIDNQFVSDEIDGFSSESFLESNELLLLREVPNDFEIRGDVVDVFDFIEDLGRLEDFIVVNRMELTALETNEWSMEIRIIKYQFQELGEPSELYQAYVQVPISASVNAEIQEYLNLRRQQEGFNNNQDGNTNLIFDN